MRWRQFWCVVEKNLHCLMMCTCAWIDVFDSTVNMVRCMMMISLPSRDRNSQCIRLVVISSLVKPCDWNWVSFGICRLDIYECSIKMWILYLTERHFYSFYDTIYTSYNCLKLISIYPFLFVLLMRNLPNHACHTNAILLFVSWHNKLVICKEISSLTNIYIYTLPQLSGQHCVGGICFSVCV